MYVRYHVTNTHVILYAMCIAMIKCIYLCCVCVCVCVCVCDIQTAGKLVTFFKGLGAHYVLDTTFARDFSLIER